MRIAVWHNLPSGGGKRALFDHVRGLVQRGHIVESWCPPTADQTYLPLGKLITEHIEPLSFQIEKPKGIAALSANHWSMTQKVKAMDRHCQICANAINQGGFDLLFANTGLYFHTTSLGYKVKLPSVLYLQEPARWLYEARPYLPWIALPQRGLTRLYPQSMFELVRDWMNIRRIRIQAREEAENARGYNRILVNTFFSRESILRTYGIDAKVCYLGIDTDQFIYRNQPRENFIVGLGAFTSSKNIKLIIEAISKVKSSKPTLIWIGNAVAGNYLKEMQSLAHELDVKFEPKLRVSDEEMVDILNRAALMAYAPVLEPFGYAPLEANACGLPVVAVAEGGVRETIKDNVNGLLVDADASEMAQAIDRLLTNPQLARQLGESGRNLIVEQWSFSPAIDQIEKHFREVLFEYSNQKTGKNETHM